MPETAQHRRDEAERLLNEPLLLEGLRFAEEQALNELLNVSEASPNADAQRRALAQQINIIRGIPHTIRAAMVSAKADLKKPGSVA